MNAPDKLTGREFEDAILLRCKSLERRGYCTIDRYGVKASRRQNGEWTALQSYPDFCLCAFPGGRAVDVEAKVCSGASFKAANTDYLKEKQLTFMLRRAKMGALCWLLIHFNRRDLKTRIDRPFTAAIRVDQTLELWRMIAAGELKQITRDDALRYGVEIHWGNAKRSNALTPDVTPLFVRQ